MMAKASVKIMTTDMAPPKIESAVSATVSLSIRGREVVDELLDLRLGVVLLEPVAHHRQVVEPLHGLGQLGLELAGLVHRRRTDQDHHQDRHEQRRSSRR